MNTSTTRRTVASILIAAIVSVLAIAGLAVTTASAASAAEPTGAGTVTVVNYGPSSRSIDVSFFTSKGSAPERVTVKPGEGVTRTEVQGDRIWVRGKGPAPLVNAHYDGSRGWLGDFADSTGVRGDQTTGHIIEVSQG